MMMIAAIKLVLDYKNGVALSESPTDNAFAWNFPWNLIPPFANEVMWNCNSQYMKKNPTIKLKKSIFQNIRRKENKSHRTAHIANMLWLIFNIKY